MIFISSFLYSKGITETLVFLEYNEDLDSIVVVYEKATHNSEIFISTKSKQKQEKFGLEIDSTGYPIVTLEPEQSLIKQKDSTIIQKEEKTTTTSNNIQLLLNILYIVVVLLIAGLSMWTFFQQFRKKHHGK